MMVIESQPDRSRETERARGKCGGAHVSICAGVATYDEMRKTTVRVKGK